MSDGNVAARPDRPRRVVTGIDETGRSTVVSDAQTTARLERPGGATIDEIWRVDALPAVLGDLDPLDARDVQGVPSNGFAVRVCVFPPATAVDAETQAAYAADLAASYGGSSKTQSVPGMHRTETVDVLTVVSGELYLVTETDETLLRPGDSVVQHGTSHAWSNRSGGPATVVAIMMAATALG